MNITIKTLETVEHAVTVFASNLMYSLHGLKGTGLYYNGRCYMAKTAVGGDHIGSEYEIEESIINLVVAQTLLNISYKENSDLPTKGDIEDVTLLVKAFFFDENSVEELDCYN